MAVVYAAQIQTTLKEILRRSDAVLTREQLIDDAVLELDVDRERVVEQLDKLDRLGEVYHVDVQDSKEVRIP